MTHQDAADSMRGAARKISAWARACATLTPDDLATLAQTMTREATRLRVDADALAPGTNPTLEPKRDRAHGERGPDKGKEQ